MCNPYMYRGGAFPFTCVSVYVLRSTILMCKGRLKVEFSGGFVQGPPGKPPFVPAIDRDSRRFRYCVSDAFPRCSFFAIFHRGKSLSPPRKIIFTHLHVDVCIFLKWLQARISNIFYIKKYPALLN